MSDQVGMSLDEIISKNKSKFSMRRGRGGSRGRGGRGGRRGAPSGRGASRGRGQSNVRRGVRGRGTSFAGRSSFPRRGGSSTNTQWNHDLYYGGGGGGGSSFSPKSVSTGRTKLVVSNLYFGVSDSDIKELFAEFGNIRSSAVHYDKSGRSLGTAHVLFERRADAMKAMNHYHNVDLDNRPMKITIEDERGPSAVAKSPLRGGRGGNIKRLQKGPRPISNGTPQRGNRRGSIGRGRGRGRGGRGGGRGQKKMPTTEELDAELEAYSVQASK